MSAEYTNSITNLMHFGALFFYFISAFIRWQKQDVYCHWLIVTWFFIFASGKFFGVFSHLPLNDIPEFLWFFVIGNNAPIDWAIAALFTAIGVCGVFIFIKNRVAQIVICVLFIVFLFASMYYSLFPILVLPQLLFSIYLIFTTRNYLRIAFILVVASNITYVILDNLHRQLTLDLPKEVFSQTAYDNDIYHLMLIVSSFVFFLAVKKGDWPLRRGDPVFVKR